MFYYTSDVSKSKDELANANSSSYTHLWKEWILLPLLAINGLELEHCSWTIDGHLIDGVIANLARTIPLNEGAATWADVLAANHTRESCHTRANCGRVATRCASTGLLGLERTPTVEREFGETLRRILIFLCCSFVILCSIPVNPLYFFCVYLCFRNSCHMLFIRKTFRPSVHKNAGREAKNHRERFLRAFSESFFVAGESY